MELEDEEIKETLKEISRRYLYGLIKQSSKRLLDDKITFMENKLIEISNCPEEKISEFKSLLRFFKSQFKQKWTSASYKEERFLNNNEKWLDSTIKLPMWSKQKSGRPTKEFEESSDRSKRRKTEEIRTNTPEAALVFAAQMSLRAAGKSDASAIIKEITKSPTRATKIRKAITTSQSTKKDIQPLTTQQALSMFVDADLSRKQYNIIRSANTKLYPCYSLLQRAKQDCYPIPQSYHVTDTCAEINLQDLVNHTASRLCKYLDDVFVNISDNEKENLELISKWGCDGSQQAQFKQKFENCSDSDANIFQSSFLPIRLIVNKGSQKKIIWQNPVPSSPRFCRPIRIRFVRETIDITKEEISYIENQAKNLSKTEVSVTSGILKVKHTFLLTMVDAKVCNAATDTLSTMRCYICNATSKEFNKLETRREENPETFKFGISVLHARIRFFESVLHLSYKLPLQKWQAKTAVDKELVKDSKIRIQQAFKKEMSLIVDVPKAGYGNTNDGNTSRRFFSDPETASKITGVDLNLIKRLKIVLEVISSGHKIDIDKFSTFCKETAEVYVRLYGWYPMTPTLHKVLIHGPKIIEHAIVPIGQLSEEAAEARNKHFRQYRLNFARKFSRTSCNRDVINRLLLTSDPLISCSRPKETRKKNQFSKEALDFFLPSDYYSLDDEEEASEDENDISSDENV